MAKLSFYVLAEIYVEWLLFTIEYYENIKYFQKIVKNCLKNCFYPKIKVIFLIKVRLMLYIDV